jgi:hypothetical protein
MVGTLLSPVAGFAFWTEKAGNGVPALNIFDEDPF